MDSTFDSVSRILPWAIGLGIGFPLLLVALGELGVYAERTGLRGFATIRRVRVLMLPALALMIFVRYILEMPSDDTVTQLAKTIFWVIVLYESLAFINKVVFDAAVEDRRQSRVPTLFRDIARFLLVGIGAALIYSEVWGKEIEAAWTALGLGSVVIGLALQEPLGNTVSGLILLAERPLAIGDWITAEEVTGKVVEINWRSVHIETLSLELKIIPNSSLYKGSFSNLSRPTLVRTETIELSFSYEVPPNRVKQVLLDLLRSIPVILKEPPPEVVAANYSGSAVVYEVSFSVSRQEELPIAKDTFLTRVWYVSRRERIIFPDQREPDTIPLRLTIPDRLESEPSPAMAIDLLQTFPQFKVGDQLKQELAPRVSLHQYGTGETLVLEGGPLDGLYVLRYGEAVLTARDRGGAEHEIGRVGPGEFFGESAIIAGHPSEFAVIAAEDVELFIIDPDALQRMLGSTPSLVREIGYMLDVRRKAVQGVRSFDKDIFDTAQPKQQDDFMQMVRKAGALPPTTNSLN